MTGVPTQFNPLGLGGRQDFECGATCLLGHRASSGGSC